MGAACGLRSLVNRAWLDQLKESDLSFELCSIGTLHVEAPGHRSEGCRQRTARSVFKGLARLEDGLFTDDARSVNLLGMARAVDDRPMSIQQLDSRVSDIHNSNRVQEEPATAWGITVFRRIACADLNADARSFGFGGSFKEIGFGHVWNSSSSERLDCWARSR